MSELLRDTWPRFAVEVFDMYENWAVELLVDGIVASSRKFLCTLLLAVQDSLLLASVHNLNRRHRTPSSAPMSKCAQGLRRRHCDSHIAILEHAASSSICTSRDHTGLDIFRSAVRAIQFMHTSD